MTFSVDKLIFLGNTPNMSPVNNRLPAANLPEFEKSQDRFVSSNPQKYTSRAMITKLSNNNYGLNKILKNNSLDTDPNFDDFSTVVLEHSQKTRDIAEKIIDNLPYSVQIQIDKKSLLDAAYLHDIGKVYIPHDILMKPDRLSVDETAKMQLHADIGYELLKNSGIDRKTLYLIRNHHFNNNKNSFINKPFKSAEPAVQVLELADIYSALTENRAYKPALSREKALTIINTDVNNGCFEPKIFNALVRATAEVKVGEKSLG